MWLEQYRRCCQDINKANELAWQVPSVGLTITGILIGAAYEFLPYAPRLGLLFFLNFLFMFALTILFAKHRLDIDAKTEFLKLIEDHFQVERVPMKTDDQIQYVDEKRSQKYSSLHKILLNRSAYYSMLFCLIILICVIGILFIGELFYLYVKP